MKNSIWNAKQNFSANILRFNESVVSDILSHYLALLKRSKDRTYRTLNDFVGTVGLNLINVLRSFSCLKC